MEIRQVERPSVNKPIMIAAMQDMGNVGNIAIDFVNKSRATKCFREVFPPYPNYVVDNGGEIEFERHSWEYRYAENLIVFGGGVGQPETHEELYGLCQEVIQVAREYSVQLIYTLGAFHTDRKYGDAPDTLVTTTSKQLTQRISGMGFHLTPGSSLITGFNGLILGHAKEAGLQGIGLFAEIDDPQVPQYRSAKSLLLTLGRLTYQEFKGIEELDAIANIVDKEFKNRKGQDVGDSS